MRECVCEAFKWNNSITAHTHDPASLSGIKEIFLTHFGSRGAGAGAGAPPAPHAASLIQNKQKWPLVGPANEIHQSTAG